jgi:hypothetical protein
MGHEIEQLAHEENPLEVLKALEKEGWLKVLVPHLSVAKVDSAGLAQLLKVKQQMQEVGLNPDSSPIAMYFLTRKLGDKEISGMQKQIHNKGFVERWRSLEDDAKDFCKKLMARDLTLPSQTWKFLMKAKPEALLFSAITARPAAVEQKLKNFLTKWPLMRQKMPLTEMAEMRITQEHAEYKKILDEAFLLLLDGKLRSHTEIVKFLEPYSPPLPPPPPPPVRRGRAARKDQAGAAGGEPPKKRGRKPKVAVEGVPVAVPAPALVATVAGKKTPAPAAAPAKQVAAPAKQKPAPPPKKQAPAKAKAPAKKPAAKKPAPKKPAPKKKPGKKK